MSTDWSKETESLENIPKWFIATHANQNRTTDLLTTIDLLASPSLPISFVNQFKSFIKQASQQKQSLNIYP
jgi:hypothetical protein